MSKLLVCFGSTQELPYIVGNKLRTIVITDIYPFNPVFNINLTKQVDNIDFTDTFL